MNGKSKVLQKNYARILFTYIVILTKYARILTTNRVVVRCSKKVCANFIALFKGCTCTERYVMIFLADIRSVSTWKKCLRMFMVSIKHTYMKKKYARILSVYIVILTEYARILLFNIKGEQSM